MKLTVQQAKLQFIQEWGNLSTNWGQPRSVGLVHGYLLVLSKPATYADIKRDLGLSQGGSNAAIIALLDIGIIRRTYIQGERAEYFVAEKDMWQVSKAIARYRQRKELEPLLTALTPLKSATGPKASVEQFNGLVDDIERVADIANKSLDLLQRSGVVSFLKLLS
jgi:DNA-binding transcriptional regulator GbsR (MarR family)